MKEQPAANAWMRRGFIMNVGVFLAQVFIFLNLARAGEFWRADFPMFYTGWSMVLQGDGAQLYDLALQARYQAEIVPERDPPGLLPFNYPPHTAVPLCLLASLSRDAAFWTWLAVQALLVGVLLHQCLALTSSWSLEARSLLVATVLAFPALQGTFQLGQMSLVILVALTGFTCALTTGHSLSAASWLVLATLKPQLAVVPIVVVLAGRQWRVLAWSCLLGFLWAALASLVLGPRIWLDWLQVIRESATQAGVLGIFPDRMYNLKCILYGLLGPDRLSQVNQGSLVLLLLVLGGIAFLWRGPWPQVPALFLRLGLSFQLGFLANPHLNPADALVYVLPALLYCLGSPASGIKTGVIAGLVLCPLLYHIDCIYVTDWQYHLRPFTLAMIALAGIMAWEEVRQRNQACSAGAGNC
ncbi:MAG: glycosyltransferase family 87 protein [Gemmataceae bacterium]